MVQLIIFLSKMRFHCAIIWDKYFPCWQSHWLYVGARFWLKLTGRLNVVHFSRISSHNLLKEWKAYTVEWTSRQCRRVVVIETVYSTNTEQPSSRFGGRTTLLREYKEQTRCVSTLTISYAGVHETCIPSLNSEFLSSFSLVKAWSFNAI